MDEREIYILDEWFIFLEEHQMSIEAAFQMVDATGVRPVDYEWSQ